ncbi:MAG: SIR2 family protein [Rhodocyclaceae bacterium]|nr:SIR2 family protein [Rhodocyclaceae bacterium]MCA3024847.1 SIR2 family protein [Rhodocyclaceae bacterium]MCA3032327.1 SIR2 family protein [Rhodocyclaceae bacterium]MCA3037844.1 SIR2 family protein [Rhodocyclaceae bacterium]MCA3039012.1 SIR2 family protein [Rhodocyclaceae bacterium]
MNSPTTTFKKDEVIVLLGAGASVDAGIPHSAEMVRQIEKLIENEWNQFKDLYNYVRSAIFYADGIRGTFDGNVSYNIERLVVALDELSRREEHPLYPFIGAWNPRLSQVAGIDFRNVAEFKTKILEKLRTQWIEIDNYDKADYFQGLVRFQKQLNFPLHVFTLNYDLCVEKAFSAVHNKWPERGFGSDRFWSHGLLDEATSESPSMYLYKLHGSIDWIRDKEGGKLTYSDSTSKIPANEGELIFGTTYKLQYVDPFLFLVYQLRRLSLEAKLIVVVGYGFGDEHINGILKQALRGDPNKRIVVASYFGEKIDDELTRSMNKHRDAIRLQLGLADGSASLVVVPHRARDFLGAYLTLEEMEKHFPIEDSLFDVIATSAEPSASTD